MSPTLDAIVLRGVERDPAQRYASARELIAALERELRAASQSEVSAWLHELAGDALRARADWLQELQRAAESKPVSLLPAATRDPIAVTRIAPDPNARDSDRTSYSEVRPRGLRLWGWSVGLAALLAALGLWQWLSWQATPRTTGVIPPAATEPRSVPLPAQPAPVAGDDAAASGAAQDWQAPEPAVAEPDTRPRPSARPSGKPRESAKPKPAPDCREPYVIDALGVKRWKRECL